MPVEIKQQPHHPNEASREIEIPLLGTARNPPPGSQAPSPANRSTNQQDYSIFSVPAHTRERQRIYYEPQLVSIGPYHRGKKHLQAMETYKAQSLQKFDQVVVESSDEEARQNIEWASAVEEAKACYFESPGLESHIFRTMLLRDGCFILDVMVNGDDGYLSKVKHLIRDDLLMMDNQMPFFVLEKLCESYLRSNPNYSPRSVVELASRYLDPEHSQGRRRPTKVRHLLHLQYYCSIIPPAEAIHHVASSSSCLAEFIGSYFQGKPVSTCCPNQSMFFPVFRVLDWLVLLLFTPIFFILGFVCVFLFIPFFVVLILLYYCNPRWYVVDMRKQQHTILSATELQEAGVKLRRREQQPTELQEAAGVKLRRREQQPTELQEAGVKLRRREQEAADLWDVHFENAILEIPPVELDESMKSLLVNLVTFEQHAQADVFEGLIDTSRDAHKSWKKFTAYALLMDSIVKTDKDVIILRQKGIIENMQGSENAIVEFFNHLCEGVNRRENHFLKGEFDKVQTFCDTKWRRHIARFKRDYFSSPWSIISLIAGFIAFAISIAGLVISIINLLHNLHKRSS